MRWRLTLLISLLFLLCSAALLAITYGLFANFSDSPPKPGVGPGGGPSPTSLKVASAMSSQRAIGLHRLQLYSGVGLAFMAIVSLGLGWLLAGRVLAPLRTITETTDRISDANLHERLALSGPRDELRLLADTIDRLLERLQAAFDAQRRFVANASHELRTPLAMMRTTLDVAIAKPGGVPAQTRELDAELRVDLDRADRLVEGFLALARAQNGPPEPAERVALEPIITAALFDRAGEIAARGLCVTTRVTPVELTGSATLLGRMIANVIDNAVRHNRPDGLIDVAVEMVGGDRARIRIDSDGARLDPREVAELAVPFKRLGRDRTGVHEGHGLGLSIVAALAAAHDGRLELHARAAGGLRATITLPATAATQFVEAAR